MPSNKEFEYPKKYSSRKNLNLPEKKKKKSIEIWKESSQKIENLKNVRIDKNIKEYFDNVSTLFWDTENIVPNHNYAGEYNTLSYKEKYYSLLYHYARLNEKGIKIANKEIGEFSLPLDDTDRQWLEKAPGSLIAMYCGFYNFRPKFLDEFELELPKITHLNNRIADLEDYFSPINKESFANKMSAKSEIRQREKERDTIGKRLFGSYWNVLSTPLWERKVEENVYTYLCDKIKQDSESFHLMYNPEHAMCMAYIYKIMKFRGWQITAENEEKLKYEILEKVFYSKHGNNIKYNKTALSLFEDYILKKSSDINVAREKFEYFKKENLRELLYNECKKGTYDTIQALASLFHLELRQNNFGVLDITYTDVRSDVNWSNYAIAKHASYEKGGQRSPGFINPPFMLDAIKDKSFEFRRQAEDLANKGQGNTIKYFKYRFEELDFKFMYLDLAGAKEYAKVFNFDSTDVDDIYEDLGKDISYVQKKLASLGCPRKIPVGYELDPYDPVYTKFENYVQSGTFKDSAPVTKVTEVPAHFGYLTDRDSEGSVGGNGRYYVSYEISEKTKHGFFDGMNPEETKQYLATRPVDPLKKGIYRFDKYRLEEEERAQKRELEEEQAASNVIFEQSKSEMMNALYSKGASDEMISKFSEFFDSIKKDTNDEEEEKE